MSSVVVRVTFTTTPLYSRATKGDVTENFQ